MAIVGNIPHNIEHWLTINGYINYQVSNFGRVRNSATGRILRLCDNGDGYYIVTIYKDCKKKAYAVHKLVANEFIDNPDGKNCVDHCDRNRLNNHVSNLRWVTRSENQRNRSMASNNTSNYKGVSWHKRVKKYQSRITHEGHRYCLGYFNTPEEAARVYDEKARELDPVHFTTNFDEND